MALGGVSLAGGRGGLLAAAIGASDIFLLQSALTYFNVSTFVLQIAYGLILVASISLNGLPAMFERRRRRDDCAVSAPQDGASPARSCWRSPCMSTGSILIEGYSSEFTIRSMLVLASLLGVASIGQTLVVLIGGIDLSTPFVIGFANVVAAQLYGDGMNFVLVCVIVGMLALVIGAVNGALSSTLAIHPLIVTLGVGTAIRARSCCGPPGFPPARRRKR